jgi:hypothetical protein
MLQEQELEDAMKKAALERNELLRTIATLKAVSAVPSNTCTTTVATQR